MTNLQVFQPPSSKANFLPALKAGDRVAIAAHLNAFKAQGVIKHDRLLRIPSNDRIPALTRSDAGYNYVNIVLVDLLARTFVNMNLRKGLNEDQLLDLAEHIIEESHEDNLAVEDVALFLQQLVVGKSGKIYDRMDIPTFFELFEGYRQERYLALRYAQYEMHCHYKSLGDSTRSCGNLNYTDDAEQVNTKLQDYGKDGKNNIRTTAKT